MPIWFVFDLIIYIGISSGILTVALLLRNGFYTNWFWRLSIVVLVLGVGVVIYGSFVEPHRLVVREVDFVLNDHPTKTIQGVLIADFHVGPYKGSDWVRRVVDKVNEQSPDIVLIPGDFVSNHPSEVALLDPLRFLESQRGVYAVTGNHEYHAGASEQVINFLRSVGIIVLENEHHVLRDGEDELIIAGISDLWFQADVGEALRDVAPYDNAVLISHNPDAVLYEGASVADLVVSGHTHGGQIRLPFLGAVPPLPTKLGRGYDKGSFNFEDLELFITSGLGETGPRSRLFNPPEIVVFTLSY